MTEKPLHAVSLATDSGVDSKSLTHHAKNAEDILSKIPHELQKLIQLHLSTGGSDRVREETNLRKRINEHLDYVINLFGHIQEEKDAREMELQKVRDEFRGIIQRFERLSHYCLAKLPTVVQKEHENVAATLVKLRWHISQAEEEHGLLSTRVHTLEAFNHKLDSDIKRLSGCTSLANEKFVIERTEMERIARETEEARKLLTESTDQLNNAEFRHQLAVDRSVKVREELATELALIEFHRKEAKRKLADAQAAFPRLTADTKSLTERARETEARTASMQAELVDCIKQVATAVQSVSRLMQENETGHKLLESLNYWLRRHQRLLDTQYDGKYANELDEARARYRAVTDRVSALQLDRLDIQSTIRVYSDRIAKSEKATRETKEDIVHLKKRMLETTNSLGQSTNRLFRIQSDHEKVTNNLEESKQRTRSEQERIRKQLSEVDNRVKEEMAIRVNLLAGIKRDIQELEEARSKAVSERRDLQAHLTQMRNEVAALEEQAKGVRTEHERITQGARRLTEQYEAQRTQWNEQRDSLNDEYNRTENSKDEKRKTLSQLVNQLQLLRSQKEKLTEEKGLVHRQIEAMLKVNVRTEDSWGQAKSSLAEMEANQRALQRQLDAILDQTQLTDIRQQERWSECHTLVQSRQTTLNEFKLQLKEALDENGRLAKSYQANQLELKQQIHAFYTALTELSCHQWEMSDAEQLMILCSRASRRLTVQERRLRAGPLLLLFQMNQHWNAVSCRLRVIQKHSEGQLCITAPVEQPTE